MLAYRVDKGLTSKLGCSAIHPHLQYHRSQVSAASKVRASVGCGETLRTEAVHKSDKCLHTKVLLITATISDT